MKTLEMKEMERIEGGCPIDDLILYSAGMMGAVASEIQLGAATAKSGWWLGILAFSGVVATACCFYMD